MTIRRRVQLALSAIVMVGMGLRIWACVRERAMHPDEFFQYLEPAWIHLTGSGQSAWEWQEGLRSWVLPFYNGAWMALLMALGVERGPTLAWLLKVHWALVNGALVLIAFRGGTLVARRAFGELPRPRGPDDPPAGYQGGLIAAILCAGYSILVGYSAHTLSELPSMLALLLGLVLTAEQLERQEPRTGSSRLALAAGVFTAMGACIRVANGPLALVAPLWLLARGRIRSLAWFCAGALAPAFVFAAVDRITWGAWAGSYIKYIQFNLLEGRAAEFGVEPPRWYLDTISDRAPLGIWLIAGAALLGLRTTWPYLLSAAGMLYYLSTQEHKEERFIIAFWPLLLIAAGGTLGALIAWAERHSRAERRERRVASPLTAALVLATLFAGYVLREGYREYRIGAASWLSQARIDCTTWVGSQPTLSALAIDEPYHTGAGLWFGSRAPILHLQPALLANPVISHVIVRIGSDGEKTALVAGFERVHRNKHFIVLARKAL